MKRIEIAKDFTEFPGVRTPEGGPFSGQEFCEKFLLPAIQSEGRTEIVFDGTCGYASSFLDEAFGSLVRRGHTQKAISEKFIFLSQHNRIIDEIWKRIKNAKPA
jgi:hypothetical protein